MVCENPGGGGEHFPLKAWEHLQSSYMELKRAEWSKLTFAWQKYALPHLNVDNMVKRNKMQQIVCLTRKIMLDRSYANVGLDPIPELVLSTPSHLSTPTHLQIDPRYKK